MTWGNLLNLSEAELPFFLQGRMRMNEHFQALSEQ